MTEEREVYEKINLNTLLNYIQKNGKKIVDLEERIEKLEQAKTYFPFSENEIRNFKVGGTD